MADIDNEEVIKAIKENIGNSSDVRIFIEETIETKICEMFESLKDRKNFQKNIISAVIITVNNALKLIKYDNTKKGGGYRKTKKLRRSIH